MKQISDLQLQFAEQQGQIIAELKEGLEQGMTDDQITEVQELLSTDPEIYPEGLVTGYFGPLTEKALKRLQNRHGLEETGEINEETREYISECFKERRGGGYRGGILNDRNISERIKERIRSHRENHSANRCRVAEKFGFSCEDGDRSNFIERLKEKIKKEMEEEEENREYEDRAEEVIEEAEEVIEELKQAIEDASDDDAIEEAEESLEEAEEMLEDAKEDFEDEKYRSAFNEAVLAIRTAMVAIKELENVEEDTTEDEAEEVVDSLEDLIAQLEDAINNADDIEAIEAALEILTEAILKLEEAEQDLNDDYYHSAAKVAEEAIELINKILEELEA